MKKKNIPFWGEYVFLNLEPKTTLWMNHLDHSDIESLLFQERKRYPLRIATHFWRKNSLFLGGWSQRHLAPHEIKKSWRVDCCVSPSSTVIIDWFWQMVLSLSSLKLLSVACPPFALNFKTKILFKLISPYQTKQVAEFKKSNVTTYSSQKKAEPKIQVVF